MKYAVETNQGSHPAYPEWVQRGKFKTPKAAWAYVRDQSVTAEGEMTAFGRSGLRVVDSAGQEYLGPESDAVVYGGSKPYSVA